MNKIIINVNGILVCMLSYLRAYCSMSQNFETFNTPNEGPFLCVKCFKYLIFDTFKRADENALRARNKLRQHKLNLKNIRLILT